MEFLFSTGSLYTYSIDRCFHIAKGIGFDGMEVIVDQRWDTRHPDYLLRLIERYEIPIRAIHSPFFATPGWPDDEPSRIQKSAALAEAVGAGIVVHHLPKRFGYAILTLGKHRTFIPIPGWDMDKTYRHWLEQDYQAFQATTNVQLCIENMPARQWVGRKWRYHHWNTVEDIQRFPSLTMDTTHLATWGLDPVAVYKQWHEQVRHIHLSNYDGREHRRPEAGILHLNHLLAQLSSDGYAGALTIELHPDTLEAEQSEARVTELLTESLAQCQQWTAGGKA